MQRHTGTFTALGDDGRQYTVHVFTDFTATGEGPHAEVEGQKELRTEDGWQINRLQKGRYQVAQTGVVLCSNAPDAP